MWTQADCRAGGGGGGTAPALATQLTAYVLAPTKGTRHQFTSTFFSLDALRFSGSRPNNTLKPRT